MSVNGLSEDQASLWSDLFKDLNGFRPRYDFMFPTPETWDEEVAKQQLEVNWEWSAKKAESMDECLQLHLAARPAPTGTLGDLWPR